MRKRYGIPYKGSKNQIAKQIVDFLPAAETLVDICAGGCAITHCAIESGKWQRVIANDIDPMPIQLFVDAVNGKYTLATEKRWIDRETFFALKDRDPYVRYCWSFGNNGKDYLYSKTIEPWKKAYHYARVCDDWSLLEAITGPLPPEAHDNLRLYIRRHNDELKRLYAAWYQAQYRGAAVIPAKLEEFPSYQNLTRLQDLEGVERLQKLESLARLESMERLQSAESLAGLQTSCLSYEQVDIPPNSVIYADIPYEGTACDIYAGFDCKRFLDWAAEYPNIFISSYEIADPRFICALEIPKAQLSNGKGYGAIKMERIYTTALSAYLLRP